SIDSPPGNPFGWHRNDHRRRSLRGTHSRGASHIVRRPADGSVYIYFVFSVPCLSSNNEDNMTFRKESRNFMRLTAVLLSCVMAFQGIASGQDRQNLKIVVVEGEGTNNDIEAGSSQPPVVEVRDGNDQPVAGANVIF